MHNQNPTAEEIQTLRDINLSMSKLMDTASTMLKSTFAKYEQEIADLRASLAAATPAELQPAAAMLSAIDGLRATVAQSEADLNPRPLSVNDDLLAGLTPDIAALMAKWSMNVRVVDKMWCASATLLSEGQTPEGVIRDLNAMMESGMSAEFTP